MLRYTLLASPNYKMTELTELKKKSWPFTEISPSADDKTYQNQNFCQLLYSNEDFQKCSYTHC